MARPAPYLALKLVFASLLIAAACWVLWTTPDWYKSQARFNLVFSKILPISPSPAQDLAELGLSQTDLPYIRQHAFLATSPAADPAWLEAFSHRGGYGQVVMFCLRHPARTLAVLRMDLESEAWPRRPLGFSNFRREDGQPPAAQTTRFGWWSAWRAQVVRWWPEHLVVWYALVLVCGPIWAWRAPAGLVRAAAWTAVFAAVLGLSEYLLTSLTDAAETQRHLLMFHWFTDVTLLLAVTFGLSKTRAALPTSAAPAATLPDTPHPRGDSRP